MVWHIHPGRENVKMHQTDHGNVSHYVDLKPCRKSLCSLACIFVVLHDPIYERDSAKQPHLLLVQEMD